MRWLVLLTASCVSLAACGGGEFTSSGSEGGSGGSGASGGSGGSGVGGRVDGGAGSGGAGSGGAGSGGTAAAGSGGMTVSDCPFPGGLRVGSQVRYHSTLDNLEALISPAVGAGMGSSISTEPANHFFGSLCEFGIQIDAKSESFSVPEAGDGHSNIDYRSGALAFYFTPFFDSSDSRSHMLVQSADADEGGFTFEKTAANELRFIATGTNGLTFQQRVAAGDYSFATDKRVHIAISWNLAVASGTNSVKIYLDGTAARVQGALSVLNMRNGDPGSKLRFGNTEEGSAWADGIFDDLWIFADPID